MNDKSQVKPDTCKECGCDSVALGVQIIALQAQLTQVTAELDNKARELVAHREKAQGNYWAWQGVEGEDHLESLSCMCPVLISAKQLLEITTQLTQAHKERDEAVAKVDRYEQAFDDLYSDLTILCSGLFGAIKSARTPPTDTQKGECQK